MKTDMDKNMDADTDISMSTDKNMFTSMSVSVSLFIIMFMCDFVMLISTDKFQDIYMDRVMGLNVDMDTDLDMGDLPVHDRVHVIPAPPSPGPCRRLGPYGCDSTPKKLQKQQSVFKKRSHIFARERSRKLPCQL